MTLADCRPEVQAFALLMETKLRENDHKGGWRDCELSYLLKRLREELAELAPLVDRFYGVPPMIASHSTSETQRLHPMTKEHRVLVGSEAADVANFAMMIADVCGALASIEPPSGGGGTGG